MGSNPTRGSLILILLMKTLIYRYGLPAIMGYKYSIGSTVSITGGGPGDVKRFPEYIRGKTGIIHAVRGPFKNPRDHLDERAAIYLVEIDMKQLSPSAKDNEKLMIDVFEDWISDEEVR